MSIIYAAVNKVNDKIYIGKTKRGIQLRALEHFKSAKRGSKTHFHAAIRTYGEDSFTWYTLQDNIDDTQLDTRERYWIARYKQLGYTLYNLTEGGEGGANFKGKTFTAEVRKRIGNRQPRTEEWKLANGIRQKERAKPVILCKEDTCIQVNNIVDWAKENGYDYSRLYKMIRGSAKSAYGWRLR